MLTALKIEIFKLNRSLAGLLTLTAPLLIPVYTLVAVTRLKTPQTWEVLMTNGIAIWAFFMLPMSAIALTTLMGQMEHMPRSWDHLRALPRPRWTLHAAKLVCTMGLLGVMTALTLGLTVGAVQAGGALAPHNAALDTPDWATYSSQMARIWMASCLMVACQYFLAMRFSNFVPALAVGIGGTFCATIATSASEGLFIPWQMPVNILATEAERQMLALGLGGGLGLLALMACTLILSRHEG